MAKVYVSSTIADLERERQALMDWLVAAGHQPIHSYRPNSDTVRDSCLDDVDTCDLYVLIAGHRYGYQPTDNNPEGLSITHLEFRRAGESGIPRVALLRTSIPDVSLSDMDDTERAALVRAFRAEVAREVRPAEFSDLTGLIGGLSTGVAAELDKLAEQKKPSAGQVAGGRVLRLAPRPAFLAGREELLTALDAQLTTGDGTGPRVVALCGLGGAGKTSVALEYAHQHLDEAGVVWQFAAEDRSVLATGFGELAAQLGARDMSDARDPVTSVHGALAAYQHGWLLVFDNAPDRASVQAFLPPAGHGRVVITSQYPHWPAGQALEVPVLDRDVAADFLVTRTGDADRQAARHLAGELGGLPLALEQAAAYIQASVTTLAEYLSAFRDRRSDLLARGEAAGHPADVAATLGLALSRLGDEAPAAAGLARLLACLASEPVPLALLADAQIADKLGPAVEAAVGPLLGDRVEVGDAVAALRRYSLVTPAGGGAVLVHRLVQAVTRAQVPADEATQWEQAAAALVEAAIPADPQQPSTWPVFAALLPHAGAVADLTSDGMWRVARYLGYSGSYAAARDLFQLIADAYRQDDAYGAEHPGTLSARGYLAYWTGEAGDAAGARDQFAALLPIRERVLGPEHRDTLNARDYLARWTGQAGDAAKARDQFAALLPIMDRVLGSEHPDTLRTRANLALNTGTAGDAAGARDQDAALLPILEQVLGPEHPDTLAARDEAARFTGEAGARAEARDQIAALLPVRERVLGPEHPGTLTTRDNLARWTGDAGDWAGARDQYAALLPIMERVLGPGHPRTLFTRGLLAAWTGDAGEPAAARDQFAALLPELERVLGPEHPDVLTVRDEAARWIGEAGDRVGARDQLAALLPIRERVLGPEHPDTLTTRDNLARWTGDAGDPAGARDQYAALVPIRERVLGPDHPKTLTARANLARWTGVAGDAAAARDQYAALLPLRERVLGPDHPDTLAARANLARWTGAAGDPASARVQLAALLPEWERVLGPDHPDTLTARATLARWTGRAGDPAGARDQFAALLPQRERVLGRDHPDTLTDRANLATWIGLAGDPAGARDLFAALLPARERVLGAEHPDTLIARSDLAGWTGLAGDPAGARDQFAALLPICRQVLGPGHETTLATRNGVARWTQRAQGSTEPGVGGTAVGHHSTNPKPAD